METRIIEAVHRSININSCPLCGAKPRWAVSPTITLLSTYDPSDNSVNPLQGLPIVTATCQSCGFVVSLDAIRLGLVSAN